MVFADLFHKFRREETQEQRSDMFLRRVGEGKFVHYELNGHSTEEVEWAGLETDKAGNPVAVREPVEITTEYSRKSPFSVAGKMYPNFNSFLKKQEGEWGEDLYGRKVLCTKERFPCFDSSDYLYENRYYRWYFIREGDSVSQVYVADDWDKVYVTEDVQNMESWAWDRMKATGFCQKPKAKGNQP